MDSSTRPFAPSRLNKTTAADYSSSASESEDEYRIPGVDPEDDDFGDFNPRKKRRLADSNKEKAALGIFASDSEDEGPGKKWKKKNLRSRGMNFVSKGAEQAEGSSDEGDDDEDNRPVLGNGSMNPSLDEKDDDDDDEEDEDEESSRGAGLGFGRGTGGSGMRPRMTFQKAASADTAPSLPKTKFDGPGVLGQGFVPSSAHEPVLKDPNGGKSPPRNKPQLSSFGAKSKGKGKAMGFGAKMMAKMGYVDGQGLGKEGQGRNVIVEANLRPQGAGLGAVKEKSKQERQEEKRQAKLRGEVVVDSDEEEEKRRRKRKAAARNKTIAGAFDSVTGSSTSRKSKTRYLTAEELKASAPGLHIPDAFTPILDMTGPGGKMLTSASGIMTPAAGGVPESTEVIEARKLVKRAQADLMAFSEEWRSLSERKAWVDLELKGREKEVEDLRSDFEKLQVFSDLVSKELVSATEWDQVIGCLRKPVEAGAATADLVDIAVAAIHPFLREAEWDPLREPSKFSTDLSSISGLLIRSSAPGAVSKWDTVPATNEDDVYRAHHRKTTPYESMMYKIWLPRVLSAIRSWDPLEPTAMLTLLESWTDLLPPFVRAQVVDNVVRRLEAALSDWNPKKRKQRQGHDLPHTWLFPWLPYLPAYHLDPKGTGLVSGVKRKFRQLTGAWEYERGVVPGLTNWKEVLGDDEWRRLTMSHVLPAMGRYLRANFRVDPADQEPYLPALTGVLKWEGVLGKRALAEVLAQNVLPMWNAKLEEWLALGAEADLAEVAEWYGWWRGVLLKDFATSEEVCGELDKGLRAMNVV
ncbi:tuftelin-interacting protein 11 [Geosmithia morbida]|uniref:Tuftelin-interacting protein 11 n=1 Tax=Geosmithia morbida TaxID=1094350 RepID=A0A9P5D514_9HYPO|nr:tuftelin-interacting protein 11 [Geosmithia morbida]KAF4122044.1 tuftelin-interacting protein 11 [Geosmithia morbida]